MTTIKIKGSRASLVQMNLSINGLVKGAAFRNERTLQYETENDAKEALQKTAECLKDCTFEDGILIYKGSTIAQII